MHESGLMAGTENINKDNMFNSQMASALMLQVACGFKPMVNTQTKAILPVWVITKCCVVT